jgi:mevalonate kinase
MTPKSPAEGYGFGKTILVGEHFVVYGYPAIAAGLSQKTICRIEAAPKFELVDQRPATVGYKSEKADQQKKSHELIFSKLGIDVEKTPFRMTLSGDLVAASGVGASAADCVSVARALNDYFSIGLDEDGINEVGFEGEKGYHGTPSGIDNSVSTFGGTIWFKKGTPPLIEKVHTDLKLHLVIVNTGKTSDTTAVVGDVRKKKESKPEWFEKILARYEQIAKKSRSALETNDLKLLAEQMNENHKLLQEITVSNKELDAIVETARNSGAIAAKLTGTGRGGLAIALCKDSSTQAKVAGDVQKKLGYSTESTTIGR